MRLRRDNTGGTIDLRRLVADRLLPGDRFVAKLFDGGHQVTPTLGVPFLLRVDGGHSTTRTAMIPDEYQFKRFGSCGPRRGSVQKRLAVVTLGEGVT